MQIVETMSPEVTAALAIEAAKSGARVLVIRNTVDRAVETLTAVESELDGTAGDLLFKVNNISTLHHSRFAARDRKLLDAGNQSENAAAFHCGFRPGV